MTRDDIVTCGSRGLWPVLPRHVARVPDRSRINKEPSRWNFIFRAADDVACRKNIRIIRGGALSDSEDEIIDLDLEDDRAEEYDSISSRARIPDAIEIEDARVGTKHPPHSHANANAIIDSFESQLIQMRKQLEEEAEEEMKAWRDKVAKRRAKKNARRQEKKGRPSSVPADKNKKEMSKAEYDSIISDARMPDAIEDARVGAKDPPDSHAKADSLLNNFQSQTIRTREELEEDPDEEMTVDFQPAWEEQNNIGESDLEEEVLINIDDIPRADIIAEAEGGGSKEAYFDLPSHPVSMADEVFNDEDKQTEKAAASGSDEAKDLCEYERGPNVDSVEGSKERKQQKSGSKCDTATKAKKPKRRSRRNVTKSPKRPKRARHLGVEDSVNDLIFEASHSSQAVGILPREASSFGRELFVYVAVLAIIALVKFCLNML